MNFKFPPWISEGAKDLIAKVLNRTPSLRLSLEGIMEHPWVKTKSRRILPPVYNEVEKQLFMASPKGS